tara:strand:+ start:925 stop:1779 length:855 start_codon:yes stop_codon:yes gene_type:complete
MTVESEQDFVNQFAPEQGAQDDNQGIDDSQSIDNSQGDNEPEYNFSPSEQKAFDQGWRPQEEFEGEEGNWKTAKEYNRDGEWMDKLKQSNQRIERMEQDFNSRLENSNKLHEARRAKELGDLKKQQREAVDMADTDAYDDASRKIDELESQPAIAKPTQEQPQLDPLVAQYVQDNPWINDPNDDRSIIASGALQAFQAANPNASIQDAIDHVDSKVKKLTANTNPRRAQPNTSENSRRQPRAASRELSMNDLTNDERSEWSSYGRTLFKTEKAFLAAVKDARSK